MAPPGNHNTPQGNAETAKAPVTPEAVSVDDNAAAEVARRVDNAGDRLKPMRELAERAGTAVGETPEEKPSVESYPLEDESPEVQAKIMHYVTLWKEADSQEKKDTYEGFLMMEGVDMDKSRLEDEKILIVPEEERGWLMIMGFIKVGMALAKRLLGNKTSLDKLTAEEGTAAPEAMPPAERFVEMRTNEEKLTEMTGTKKIIENALVSMKADLGKASGDAKTKLEKDIGVKEKELTTITTKMTALEQRQLSLQEADKASPMQLSDADRNALKQEKDPILRAFLARKIIVKEEIRSTTPSQALDAEDLQRMAELLPGAKKNKEEALKFIEETLPRDRTMVRAIIDEVNMESDNKGNYRLTVNIPKMKSASEAATKPLNIPWTATTTSILQEGFVSSFEEKDLDPTQEGEMIVTKWLTKNEAQTYLASLPSI